MAITDGFKTTLNPDNRFQYPEVKTIYTIDISGTVTHTFILDVPYSTIGNIDVAYRQGVETLLDSALVGTAISHGWVDVGNGKTNVTVNLTRDQTRIFKYDSTTLDTFVQLAVFTIDNKVTFSKPYPVWVNQPIGYVATAAGHYEFNGLSTDTKPIYDWIGEGSTFFEMDTSSVFMLSRPDDGSAASWVWLDPEVVVNPLLVLASGPQS